MRYSKANRWVDFLTRAFGSGNGVTTTFSKRLRVMVNLAAMLDPHLIAMHVEHCVDAAKWIGDVPAGERIISPLAIHDAAILVVAGRKRQRDFPCAISVLLQRRLLRIPVIEGARDADVPRALLEESEMDDVQFWSGAMLRQEPCARYARLCARSRTPARR